MSRSDNLYTLPENLPIPADDGACSHLTGSSLPSLALPSTRERAVNLAKLQGWVVIYCYPRTGQPDQDPPSGWNDIPGARGCTPQTCAFRDHHQDLRQLGAQVFGLSAQDTPYQKEAVARLHLPFELLSDSALTFATHLNLPTFEIASMKLLKRVTLIARDGVIQKVFYPVFPPDKNAEEVITWLRGKQKSCDIV
ncbi:MAG: peroxiredoxin [Anaerolineales bacterium]|nr:peroxiredoxin [Anaerolineales bacterium]